MRGGWTVDDEIRHVDDMLRRLGVALDEAHANGDHSDVDCEATRDELLDLRLLLVAQRSR